MPTETNTTIIFDNLEEAIAYNGNKECILRADVDLEDVEFTGFNKITKIEGNVSFTNVSWDENENMLPFDIAWWGELKEITGYARFSGCEILSLGKLEKIGEDAIFNNAISVMKFSSLKSVGWRLDLSDSNITGFGNLEYVGRGVNIHHSGFKSDELDALNLKF